MWQFLATVSKGAILKNPFKKLFGCINLFDFIDHSMISQICLYTVCKYFFHLSEKNWIKPQKTHYNTVSFPKTCIFILKKSDLTDQCTTFKPFSKYFQRTTYVLCLLIAEWFKRDELVRGSIFFLPLCKLKTYLDNLHRRKYLFAAESWKLKTRFSYCEMAKFNTFVSQTMKRVTELLL